MNKEQLIDKMAGDADVTKVAARAALASFIDAVKKALKKGDRVGLIGFGTFSSGKRKARVGRNPKTGAPLKIAAKKTIRFKAGKDFNEFLNGKK